MIVEAFKDSLELGLEKHSQIVVSIGLFTTSRSVKMEVMHFADDLMSFYSNFYGNFVSDQQLTIFSAYDTYICLWLAYEPRKRRLPRR